MPPEEISQEAGAPRKTYRYVDAEDCIDAAVESVVEAMLEMSPEQRLDVMHEFCLSCGTDVLPCHCSNDD